MTRFLLIDDHEVVRIGLKTILADTFAPLTFNEAANGSQARQLAMRAQSDLIIVEISLDSNLGLDLLKDLRRTVPRTPVLVFTVHSEKQYALRAIRAGASGYVTKVSFVGELLTAIRKTLQGGRYVSTSLAEALTADISRDTSKEIYEHLSDREFQVMRLIGSGKTVSQIAALLSISDKTVSTYRARILQKTGMRNNAKLIRYSIEQGFAD